MTRIVTARHRYKRPTTTNQKPLGGEYAELVWDNVESDRGPHDR
jgi:hypothetical protein